MKLKPFTSIPGPKSLPLIGTLHKYLPVIGKYDFNRLHRSGFSKYSEYGPLVRERLIMNVNLLYVFDPEDIGEIFAHDGKYPFRRSHTALQKYRLDRPHMYSCGGLIPTNGEEWWRLRREAQKVMTRLQCVKSHLPVVNEICSTFIELINRTSNSDGTGDDFLQLLKKLFLELTMQTTVDYRFNCLDAATNSLDSEAFQLMWAADASTKSILATDNGIPFWKIFNTPLYKQLTLGQDMIYKIALKYVERKEHSIRYTPDSESENGLSIGDRQLTMLEYFILKTELSRKDILTLVCDSLLAGIDTTAYTSSFILYHLARNPEKQDKLAEEAKILLSENNGEINNVVLSKARYTKAVVKESFRLNPISIGVGRIATQDFALRNYLVPKGTVIVTQNQVSCRLKEYFPEPDCFIPERWLDRESRTLSPFLLLPFGHGPRACIGRRLAEQNIFCLLLQICKSFRIRWEGKPNLDCYSHLINEPDAKLHFKFVPRE